MKNYIARWLAGSCLAVVSSTLLRWSTTLAVTLFFAFTSSGTPANALTVTSTPISQVLAGGDVSEIALQSDGKVLMPLITTCSVYAESFPDNC
jgi:hypothetical protein